MKSWPFGKHTIARQLIVAAVTMLPTDGGAATPTADARDVIVWHTFDPHQGQFLNVLVDEFNRDHHSHVRLETGMELPQALIEALDEGMPPDAVFAPADLIALAKEFQLSEVPVQLAPKSLGPSVLFTVSVGAHAYGAPILDGNHLMLYYNRRLVKSPATSLASLSSSGAAKASSEASSLAWEYDEPYMFAAFLLGEAAWPIRNGQPFLRNNPAMATALHRYLDMAHSDAIAKSCDYDCVTRRFFHGEFTYAINGDWALVGGLEALGTDLGIAPLPTLAGHPLRSLSTTQALMFPAHALAGPKAKTLVALAEYLQSAAVQRRWVWEVKRLPVDPALLRLVAAGATPIPPAVLATLRGAVRVPPVRATALIWPALRKGLRLVLGGLYEPVRACDYMQSLVDGG